ncbi:Uncharacterised protein [Vibrio cholerae]|nr:Uncharacterised protein [Vibrio cholerae]CSB13045.1 Uncharacterised protein [Vibrio cholerae]
MAEVTAGRHHIVLSTDWEIAQILSMNSGEARACKIATNHFVSLELHAATLDETTMQRFFNADPEQ